jgi:hypothetical protein
MKYLYLIFCLFLLSCNNALDPTKTDIVTKTDAIAGCWTDFRIGELPPVGYYDGIDSLVKKWNLCYTRLEGGCVLDDSTEVLRKKYKMENENYFVQLESKLGKDWKLKFENELRVLDSMNWIKINKTINSLNKK